MTWVLFEPVERRTERGGIEFIAKGLLKGLMVLVLLLLLPVLLLLFPLTLLAICEVAMKVDRMVQYYAIRDYMEDELVLTCGLRREEARCR